MSHLYLNELSTEQALELFNKYSPKETKKFESRKKGLDRLRKMIAKVVFNDPDAHSHGGPEVLFSPDHLAFNHEKLEYYDRRQTLPEGTKVTTKPAPKIAVDTTPDPVEEKVIANDKKPKGVGQFIREKLIGGADTSAILEAIRAEFPQSKATNKDVSIMRSKLRKEGLL